MSGHSSNSVNKCWSNVIPHKSKHIFCTPGFPINYLFSLSANTAAQSNHSCKFTVTFEVLKDANMNGSRSKSIDALSFKSGVSGYSKASVNTSQAMGGVLANILSSLLLLLSTPILIFGGFILVYFYHVQSFGVVSDWFYFLPYAFFACGVINLITSISISIFQIIPTGLCKTLFLMVLCVFLVVSCILNGISTYGCSELHSIILQQNFLSVNIGGIMD